MQLLRTQGFIPYLIVAFLNAFVDLGHKIIIQNTIFKLYDGQEQIILTAIINAFILLPFILMFTPAGFISDRLSKHIVIRLSASLAIIGTLFICFAYYQGWFWFAFAMTLFIAAQSAIYSPSKYGYIKELVGSNNLAAANGYVQAVTIISILSSTFVFSILFENLLVDVLKQDSYNATDILKTIAPIGWILVGLSVIELGLAFFLKEKHAGDKNLTLKLKPYIKAEYLKHNIGLTIKRRPIRLSIIGLCMFWSISQVVLASFPAYAKEVLMETNTIMIQGILACTGIGIMFGSMFAGFMSRKHLELGFIPLGTIGIVTGLLLMGYLDQHLHLIAVFLLLGFSGGLFIVPLNSLIQYHGDEDHLGTILAGNNWFQNVSMVLALCLTVSLAYFGINSQELFLILALVALVGSIYTIKQLPQSLARTLASWLIKRRYKFVVEGFDNLPTNGGTLLLSNHVTWIDWILLQIACPRPIRFVMFKDYYEKPVIKPILSFFKAIPISPRHSKAALKEMAEALDKGEVVCLFPEGKITTDGEIHEFKAGYLRAIELSSKPVKIVPCYLGGMWGSRWSKATPEQRGMGSFTSIRRIITVKFLDAQEQTIQPEILRSLIDRSKIISIKK